MSTYLSAELRCQLVEADDHRCAYCQTTAANTGQPMIVDHVLPEAQGGQTTLHNLCCACLPCNRSEGSDLTTFDPLSNTIVPLFNPRQHTWSEHFILDDAIIVGLTPIGRATVVLLKLNAPTRLLHRRVLVAQGRYP